VTFLEAINAVLRRLREDTVTSSNSTDYSKLIGDFVNQAVYECEHAWDWNELKTTITINTVSGTDNYAFSNSETKIIQVVNDTKKWLLRPVRDDVFYKNAFIGRTTGSPQYYVFLNAIGSASNTVFLQPEPDGVETIYFLVVKHTEAYAIDGSDDASVITIPTMPIVLNAYAKAISERGEDGGIGFNEADQAARFALADAISLDSALNHQSKVNWHAV